MTTTKQRKARKPRQRQSNTIIVEHEFIGTQTIYEALTPIIVNDLQRKIERIRTFDSSGDKA